MKKQLKFIALVLIICFLCLCFVGCGDKGSPVSKADAGSTEMSKETKARINELTQQIDANIEVKTYKNTIVLYEELIELEPDNIDWHVGLADAYRMIGQSSRYKNMCEDIIDLFPEDKSGYVMLIRYYADKGYDKRVISTFNEAPSSIQANKEFLDVYEESEWAYRLRGSRQDFIGLYGNGLYVYMRDGLFGYKKSDLYSSISAQFEIARPFIEKHAAVYKDKEWYFIDTAGYKVLATKEKIEDLYSFSEGYAVAKMNGKYGYIDSDFNKYHFDYEDATSFYSGVAAVKQDGKWALIDKDFQLITSFMYDDVIRDEANVCSREGVIFLHINGAYHMINATGQEITTSTFSDANLFYSEYAAVKRDGKWGFVNTKGKIVIGFKYEDASSFASDVAAVKKNGKWGCITKDEKIAIPFEYEDALITFDNGVVVVKIKNYYKFAQFVKHTV